MVIDIAPQQHLSEIFSTNHTHHRSSSSSTNRRNSTTTSTALSSNTMTNGHRLMDDELTKKAVQILGPPTDVVDYCRQPSIFSSVQHAPRLSINAPKSRTNNNQVISVTNSNQTMSKNRHLELVDQLVPLIFKVVTTPKFTKLSEIASRHSKTINNITEKREIPVASHDETNLKLSDDENDDDDDKISNENQIKNQHTDSDDQVSNHSDTENDDELNRTNPHTLSLSDFIPVTRSSIEPSMDLRKRSLSPSTPAQEIKQTKRKEKLIKSFSSFVNIPIDIKQPTLPITIPTYLFSEPPTKTEDDQSNEKQQKPSKRYANGSMKHETTTNMIDNSNTTNGTQQKKNKTSHIYKQEPTTSSTTIRIKEESNVMLNAVSSNEILSTDNATTIAPVTVPPKKEKPTANVKPLLQTTLIDNLSSTTNNSNVLNTPDRLTTATANTSAKAYYTNLKNMSIKELNSLARDKKKQADGEKRTFEDVKQSMSLYLESVCYFIRCAPDEPIVEQRTSLLATILSMLQQLVHKYDKMFHIPTNQSIDSLNNIRQKFLLINYWLQSFIYQMQYNINLPAIERCATQVTEYFNHSKSPSDTSHSFIYEFSKHMINSYQSNYYWHKAERLKRDEPLKKFTEQLLRQNQNRRLTRDDSTIDFLLYIFDAIDLLRSTVV